MLTKYLMLLLLSLALVIFAAACSPVIQPVIIEQNPPPLAPTATPLPEKEVQVIPASSTPTAGAADSSLEWQSITPPDESVTFELPASWRHFGQDTNWSPDEGETRIGLRMGWNTPGTAIEAGLIPEGAKILETETEMMNKMSVRRFRVETAAGFETHLILVRADSMVFDFLLHAPTETEMDSLYPVLVHAVESAVFP